jgi:ribosomal protein L19E
VTIGEQAERRRYLAELADQHRIDDAEYERLYPFEDPHLYERVYGPADPDWDR